MLDISLSSRRSQLCNGVSRRDFVRVGALAPLGLSLGHLLSWEKAAAGASAGASADAAVSPRAKSVLLIYLGGGLSHHDTFDLKPDAIAEIRGKYHGIPSNIPGLHVGELLPRMAKCMDQVCLVRSGTHENDHHDTATNWVLSGKFGSPFGDHPSMGAIVAHETGFTGKVPPYVAAPKNPSFTWELGKSAWLGGRFESFKAGNANDKNWKVRDLVCPAAVTPVVLERRRSLLQAVDTLSSHIKANDQIATYDEFSQKAAEMILSPDEGRLRGERLATRNDCDDKQWRHDPFCRNMTLCLLDCATELDTHHMLTCVGMAKAHISGHGKGRICSCPIQKR